MSKSEKCNSKTSSPPTFSPDRLVEMKPWKVILAHSSSNTFSAPDNDYKIHVYRIPLRMEADRFVWAVYILDVALIIILILSLFHVQPTYVGIVIALAAIYVGAFFATIASRPNVWLSGVEALRTLRDLKLLDAKDIDYKEKVSDLILMLIKCQSLHPKDGLFIGDWLTDSELEDKDRAKLVDKLYDILYPSFK